LRGDDPRVHAGLLSTSVRVCDWTTVTRSLARLRELPDGVESVHPFILLAVSDDPLEHLRCSRVYAAKALEQHIEPPMPHVRGGSRIRVAYLSPDFRDHPVARLLAGLIESHDRERFEIIGISLTRPDESEIGRRITAAFDSFVDVSGSTDAQILRRIRELQVDIAVDLAGFTNGNRLSVLASRAAPIQVNYFGFPGTMGAGYMDYILADPTLVTPQELHHYTEKVVWLPDTYQVNDRHYAVTEPAPSRADLGLPARGFVFCCFNNSFKINSEMFAVWMRLLARVENSVLWLSGARAEVISNLRTAASGHGIAVERLVFAPQVARNEDHLARYRCADLFLDTLPFNAHATATDALWCGVPVLTCHGATFAGRVATSILQTLALPELVTRDLAAYEALALSLANSPQLLEQLRGRLARNRRSHPLFDTDRFRRHIEAAYLTMWERSLAGEAPMSFAVPAIEEPTRSSPG
jgi:predicted O-linked N-acetylglucosamine transferase (SPINDLY family)